MEPIIRWVALWLAKILETYGDPTLQAKLDSYNQRVAAAELRERQAQDAERASEAAYQTSVNRRGELDRLLQLSQAAEDGIEQQLVESQQRLKQIQDEADKTKQVIDSRSDRDAVRGDL